jgi:RNA polymerase sigma-70 factor (ECF subfamily)
LDYNTRQTLLIRIKDANNEAAWSEFVEIYTPLLYRFAERRGISASERADIIQETLRSVTGAIERFEHNQAVGSFRGWLYTVARSKIANHFRQQARRPQAIGGTTMAMKVQEQPDPKDEVDWVKDYRQRLFEWAAQKVKQEFAENTWAAFWRTSVDDEEVSVVCETLEMSRGAVYVAKSRVVARIREKIASVAGEWVEPDEFSESRS